MLGHAITVLSTIFLLFTGEIFCDGEVQKIIGKEKLVKKSVETKENQRSPLSLTLDNLLQGMELAQKRSVQNNNQNKHTDKKELPDWLKLNPETIENLKGKANKIQENLQGKKITVPKIPDWLKEKQETVSKILPDWLKSPPATQPSQSTDNNKNEKQGKLPDWLKPSLKPTTPPNESIDSNENIDLQILNELANGEAIEINNGEKKTVDHFIDALREIADEETKHELQEITNQEDPKNVFNKRQDDSASNQESTSQCKDLLPYCSRISTFCSIPNFKKEMKMYCAATCNFCSKRTQVCEPDISEKRRCSIIKMIGLCKQPTAQALCATTCVCEVCENSLHGCCWDKRTVKEDQIGSNCPECKDKYHSSICKLFQKDCMSETDGARKWMKTNCMKTCQLCSERDTNKFTKLQRPDLHQNKNTCQDAKNQEDFCPIWKNAKWCEEKQTIMQKLCPKTCYNCNFTNQDIETTTTNH